MPVMLDGSGHWPAAGGSRHFLKGPHTPPPSTPAGLPVVSEVKLMLGRAERELAQGAAGGQKIRAILRGEETLK